MLQWVMQSGNAIVDWNEKQSKGAWSAAGLLHIYSGETASVINRGAFIKYAVHDMRLIFGV